MCDRISGRNRRDTANKSEYMSTDVSKISFRVEMPAGHGKDAKMQSSETNPFAVIGVVGTISIIVLALLIGFYIKQRNKNMY